MKKKIKTVNLIIEVIKLHKSLFYFLFTIPMIISAIILAIKLELKIPISLVGEQSCGQPIIRVVQQAVHALKRPDFRPAFEEVFIVLIANLIEHNSMTCYTSIKLHVT